MLKYMRLDLPASFRITGFRSQALALRDFVQGQYLDQISNLADQREKENATSGKAKASEVKEEEANEANEENETENREIVRPTKLSWYPDGMAWQLNITRKDIRRDEAFFKLHNFLISETESGNISRQETVSMIPPLVLDVKPHHKVLDMCAAPGSKTGQLIEAMHAIEDVIPEGLVVANDSDNSRCYMLVHQAKRLQSPCFIITNHDASIMPNLQVTTAEGTRKNLKYDRILCDVPCSGDGTLRKNADIWPKWNPLNSCNLHGVQYRIAKRGLEMLAVGGRMVYSTCSLHPVEDEAIIARILQECEGSVKLVDVSDKLPGLQYSKGLLSWKLASKKGEMYDKIEDVPEAIAKAQIRPHMFAPPKEVGEALGLEKCLRLLPHHHNTGGFFLALLEKTSLCPWESTRRTAKETTPPEEVAEDVENLEIKSSNEPPQKRFRGFKEDPFIYFNGDEDILGDIRKYYNLSLSSDMFLHRNKEPGTRKKNIYFTTTKVRSLVENNAERVKIINTGIKAFARADNKGSDCDYRIAQEGALSIIPFIKNRTVTGDRSDIVTLLQSSDIEKPPEISMFSENLKKQLENIPTGSVIYLFKDETTGMPVEFVGWKGKTSLRAYVPKNERLHYLRMIGEDTSMFETNKFEEKKERDKIRFEDRENLVNANNGVEQEAR